MLCSTQLSRAPVALRLLFAVAASILLPAACTDPDALPTGPSIPHATAPQPTVAGTDVTLLPTLGGTWVEGADINDAGQVVGWSYLPGDSIVHAFLWTPGRGIQDLGTLGGSRSEAAAINNLGQVVGLSTTSTGRRHPFLWTPEQGMEDLVGFVGTFALFNGATDINDAGQVVGYTAYGDPSVYWERAFVWTRTGGIQDLGTLGGVFTHPEAINNAGQVVGESQTRRVYHAFLWTPTGGMQDLGTLPGLDGIASFASDINEAGQIVGHATADLMPLGLPTHAILWSPGGAMQDLGVLAGALETSSANGINDLGQVVGGATSGLFVWTAVDGMAFLAPMQGHGSLAKVNNRGQAVGGNRVISLRFTPERAFVTGSGFYAAPGQIRNAVHFTLDAKLPAGASLPNGRVRLWIPGGRFDFESSVVEMLVVSGNRAQLWGTGTLDGAAARFRVTVVDGDMAATKKAADAIRVELWNASGTTLRYDTQPGAPSDAPLTTSLGGGNIQITLASVRRGT